MADFKNTSAHWRVVQAALAAAVPVNQAPARKKAEPHKVAKKSTGMTELSRTACFLQRSYTPSASAELAMGKNHGGDMGVTAMP